jgi:exonuclease III
MSIASFFRKPGASSSSDEGSSKRQKTEAEAALTEPLTFVVWNANSLISRVDSNRGELRSFLETTSPDVVYISEVRMPAAAPPGAKVGDGQPRSHGKLSTATKAASEEAERVKAFVAQAGYRAYFSLAEKKYAGSALLVKRSCTQPTQLRFSLDADAPASAHDREGRVVLASFASLDFLGTYVPNNGGSEESFARRRAWDEVRPRAGAQTL